MENTAKDGDMEGNSLFSTRRHLLYLDRVTSTGDIYCSSGLVSKDGSVFQPRVGVVKIEYWSPSYAM